MFVQERDNQATSGTTVSITLPSTASGNLIVAYVVWDNTGSASVSDSSGNVYASAVGPTKWNNSRYSAQVFFARNLKSGSNTIMATFASSIRSFGTVYAHEYSGVDQSTPIDATAAAVGSSGSLNSGSAITTSAVDLLFGAGVSTQTVTAPGSGYTVRATSHGDMTEDRNVSTKGSYSATASNSGGAWAMQMVALRGAGSVVDTTAPTVPSGLVASTASSSQINLSWTASSDPDNTPGQLSYGIYRNGARVGTTTAGATAWSDTGLAAATTYTYAVSAQDPAGNASVRSASVQATTSLVTSDTIAAHDAERPDGHRRVGFSDQFELDGLDRQCGRGRLPGLSQWGSRCDSGPDDIRRYQSDAVDFLHLRRRRLRRGGESLSAITWRIRHHFPKLRGLAVQHEFPARRRSPISEGGNWVNGKATGLRWADVATLPGLAYGTESGSGGYDDSTAVLAGSWGPDQTVQATVHTVNQNSSLFEEVELRLRTVISPDSITGYEVNYRCTSDGSQYVQVVRWNGPLGSWTLLDSRNGPGLRDGDHVKATIVGSTITAYINNVAIFSVTDRTFTNGSPGMGFYLQNGNGSSVNKDFGFTSFSASDGSTTVDSLPPTVPTNLSGTAVLPSQINLSWTASTDNVHVAGYQVYRNTIPVATTTSAAFSDTGLTSNTSYVYAVSAFDAAGNTSATIGVGQRHHASPRRHSAFDTNRASILECHVEYIDPDVGPRPLTTSRSRVPDIPQRHPGRDGQRARATTTAG